jgi:hypothetical protein
MPELNEHTVAELDELAVANEVEEYPSGGSKAEKVAALEAAGVEADPDPDPVYRLQLRADYFDEGVTPTASFTVSEPPRPNRSVNLTEGEVFETTDRATWLGLRDLPFLEEVG